MACCILQGLDMQARGFSDILYKPACAQCYVQGVWLLDQPILCMGVGTWHDRGRVRTLNCLNLATAGAFALGTLSERTMHKCIAASQGTIMCRV